ncbi:MAG: hypothetical protein M3340_13710 [Actinomycetota bacterium]|nr:hypothetical protein [Actinomycetota bacterium]
MDQPSDTKKRIYEFELRLEELCVEWKAVEIETTSIHTGIDEKKDPVGTATFLAG